MMGAMNASPLVAAAAAVFRASPLSNPLAETFNPPRVSPHGVYSVKLHVNGKWRCLAPPCMHSSETQWLGCTKFFWNTMGYIVPRRVRSIFPRIVQNDTHFGT